MVAWEPLVGTISTSWHASSPSQKGNVLQNSKNFVKFGHIVTLPKNLIMADLPCYLGWYVQQYLYEINFPYFTKFICTVSGPRFFRFFWKLVGRILYTHIYYHYFFLKKNISFDGARPEKGLKIWPFSKMSKMKIFIFEYFSKMNSNYPFYPILIPNTPYVKFSLFFFLVVGGSKGVPKI